MRRGSLGSNEEEEKPALMEGGYDEKKINGGDQSL